MVKKRTGRKARKIYQTLKGTHRKGGDAIYKVRNQILNGYVLAIDPASVSLGYALYQEGKLILSGSIQAKGDISGRLGALSEKLKGVLQGYPVDVLAVEFLRTGVGHHFLVWSVGMIVSTVRASHVVEVHTQSWKKLVTASYKKSDENDAIAIGRFVVELAKETE